MNPEFDEVIVETPSRLHFGLFAVGEKVQRKFGGIGLMVAEPRNRIVLRSVTTGEVGSDSKLIQTAKQLWCEFNDASGESLPVAIEITSTPQRHVGLGSGTQISLAIGTGLDRFFGVPKRDAVETAAMMQRAKRSAIGTYGFFRGGFVVDRGVTANDQIAPLDLQTEFPTQWPIVLFIGKRKSGLFGSHENDAFRKLPDVTPQQQAEMIELARMKIIPGILSTEYDQFAESVYEFGYRCGQFFSEFQGGPFNGKLATELVASIRDFGVKAVGQSSWGPCIFACASNDEQAEQLVTHVHNRFDDEIETIVTHADNRGHVLTALKPEIVEP